MDEKESTPKTGSKRKRDKRKAGGDGASGGSRSARIKHSTDARTERRFEPKASGALLGSVLAASMASVALGAGVYGEWMRGELGAYPYASYLMLGGGAVLALLALFGPRPSPALRVGDAGLALEKDGGEIERIGWSEITKVLLSADLLTFQSSGVSIAFPLGTQPDATAFALAEAKRRIPGKVEAITRDLGPASADAGQTIDLDPPQVAGLHCKQSDKLLSFEENVRLCGLCGEAYDKDSVPSRCLTCDARLRAS